MRLSASMPTAEDGVAMFGSASGAAMRSTLESSAEIPAIVRRRKAVSSPFGGILRACLYANIKVVGLGRDARGGPHWKRDLPRFPAARGLRRAPLPAVPSADQGSRGERHQRRHAHFWPAVEFQTRRGSQPPSGRLNEVCARKNRDRQMPACGHHEAGAGYLSVLEAVKAAWAIAQISPNPKIDQAARR